MDEKKKPTIEKLTQKIWDRYQKGSARRGIKPRNDLGACINASFTRMFDYRAYLLELPRCRSLREARPDLKLMPEKDLMQIPRDEAMRLLEHEISTVLERRIQIIKAAKASAWTAENGTHMLPTRTK